MNRLVLAASAALVLATATPRAYAAEEIAEVQANAPPKRDCAFGLLVFCLATAERNNTAPDSRFRFEAYGGYKFSNTYYREEIRGCDKAGCSLAFRGPAFGIDSYYNLAGNPRSDDYTAVGLSVSYMPVLSDIKNNAAGFQGELGRVDAGAGSLGYVPIRLSIRRPSFLYLIRSKYLVSAFGAGIAIPVTSGVGPSFTGGDSVKITIGGRLGAEFPLSDSVRVGIATSWTVVWYGSTFGEASFASAYGANVAYLL